MNTNTPKKLQPNKPPQRTTNQNLKFYSVLNPCYAVLNKNLKVYGGQILCFPMPDLQYTYKKIHFLRV